MEVKEFAAPYGQDNDLNVFKDFHTLVCRVYKDGGTEEIIRTDWMLQGDKMNKVLFRGEVKRALENFFFQQVAAR